ncbi:hypothetical protein [Hahella sp. NBU794]|uniref:hypothetical protein n=1 Tax=Hahella sp. NBU794 TaxID=3422590 RepID=UPI003D6EE1F9
MSILKNAIDSIAIGLEDYESAGADDRRIVSSARNIFAGILLLFKHKLCELSPNDSDEALIKQKILPEIEESGAVKWVGKGKKTVDVQNIKERFESLGITVDWKRIDKINKYRNDIEHYFSTLNTDSVHQLISDSFIIVRDFISEELKDNPKTLLGDDCWNILVEINEVHEKEKQECVQSIDKLNFLSDEIGQAFKEAQCVDCGSDLIEAVLGKSRDAISSSFRCRSCDHEESYDNLVNGVVSNYYVDKVYLSYTDGDDAPYVDCPSCVSGLYIFHEGICAACGYSAAHICQRCGGNIPPSEISDTNFCGYCSYMLEKLKRE